MQKRSNSYLLLFLLVVTGFAGREYSATLSNPERRLLTDGLKSSKMLYLKSVQNLSEAQLDFRPGPGKCSIREHMNHLAAEERLFLNMTAASFKKPEEERKCSEKAVSFTAAVCCSQARSPEKSPAAATLNEFKKQRNLQIRYARTTTGNWHRQPVTGIPGNPDTYQVLLLLPAHTLSCVRQIEAIKAHPQFPQQSDPGFGGIKRIIGK